MKKLFTVWLSFVLILALGSALLAAAQTEEKAKTTGKKAATADKETSAKGPAKARPHRASGKVVAISDKELKVESKLGKEPTTLTFALNDSTQKPAELKEGSEVTVWYKSEGDQKVATRVTTKAAKATRSKAAKKTTT